jgi:3-dehydroquinate synthase
MTEFEFDRIEKPISVTYLHRIFFTNGFFDSGNRLLRQLLAESSKRARRKALVVLDVNVANARPELEGLIRAYFDADPLGPALAPILMLSGGEKLKNDPLYLDRLYREIDAAGICRHSHVIAVGGGALLDLVGFASATAHRGIQHIRVPTTTLSQADGGVGVKNSVNFAGKKNFIGTFAPPFAVINDFDFLRSLPPAEARAGFIEAVKVAVIKDAEFFAWIERNLDALKQRDACAMAELVRRSAALHVNHIADSGDPFERESARPLDFGHWAAHKIEPMSHFLLSHGEAVAIGMAVDVVYSRLMDELSGADTERILHVIEALGFRTFSPLLLDRDTTGAMIVLNGLEEFREHLGGMLTISLLRGIGKSFEANAMDDRKILEAFHILEQRQVSHNVTAP